jgi:hypothetical protein
MNRSAKDGAKVEPALWGRRHRVPLRRTKVCAGDTVGKSVSDSGRPGIVQKERYGWNSATLANERASKQGMQSPAYSHLAVGADISASEIPTDAVLGVGSGRGTLKRGQSKRPRIVIFVWRRRTDPKGRLEGEGSVLLWQRRAMRNG